MADINFAYFSGLAPFCDSVVTGEMPQSAEFLFFYLKATVVLLTLKAPITTSADDIH